MDVNMIWLDQLEWFGTCTMQWKWYTIVHLFELKNV